RTYVFHGSFGIGLPSVDGRWKPFIGSAQPTISGCRRVFTPLAVSPESSESSGPPNHDAFTSLTQRSFPSTVIGMIVAMLKTLWLMKTFCLSQLRGECEAGRLAMIKL